jgi:parallel beta-helix repeat protein
LSGTESTISLWDSSDCAIENSILEGQGIEMGFYELSTFNFRIENVTLDGKLVGYFEGISSTEVDCFQYNQIILAYCSEVELLGWDHSNLTGGIVIWSSEGIWIRDLILKQLNMNLSNSSWISDVTVSDGTGGIQVFSCIDLYFENITIQKTWGSGGFDIDECQLITIIDSRIQSDRGITIYASNGCLLSDLQIETIWNSLYLSASNSCILQNSLLTCIWDETIRLRDARDIQIEDCLLGNGGIAIYGEYIEHWSHTMNNITLDDKPLGYFKTEENLAINGDSYGQLIFAGCHYITLQNVELSLAAHGLQFAFSTNCRISDVIVSLNPGWSENLISCDSFIIERLAYYGNAAPFRISHSNNVIVRDSYFSQQGIEIHEGSWNCSVTENTFNDAGSGIVISSSSHCTVSNNRLSEGWQGINLYNGEGIDITNNNITHTGYGIFLWSSARCLVSQNTIYKVDVGIDIGYGDSNKITGNSLRECEGNGISIYDETNLITTYNNIIGTDDVGIQLLEGTFNLFYGNLFYNNAVDYPELPPVIDDGNDNQWDNGEGIGNCWGLYEGEGPYEIEGTAGSEDRYPIYIDSTDLVPPIISSPADIVLQGDEIEPGIQWIVWSPPGTFTIYQNGFRIGSGLWNGSGPFFHELINSGIGNQTFTLEIYDAGGIMGSDSVIVQGPIALTNIVQISAAGAGAIIVIGLVFLEVRKRRRVGLLVESSISSEA